ncbi:MAG: dephospho-CoA kinase, partial [Sedimenticola sp.]|nr:dephospho-CoA kinase [Sedimenticola sp.]
DRVLVVDCTPEVQISRVTQRDNASEEQTRAIIASQIDRNSRLAAADDVIDNSGQLSDLQPQVMALHQKYLKLAN